MRLFSLLLQPVLLLALVDLAFGREPVLWPFYSGSSGGDTGEWSVGDFRVGWEDFFTSRDRRRWSKSGRFPCPIEFAEQYGRLWIHNPGGHGSGQVMEIQQFQRCREYAAKSGEKSLLRASNTAAFTHYASEFRQKGFELAVYFGQPQALVPLDGETPAQWVDRSLEEIKPALDVRPRINVLAFDAAPGHSSQPEHPVWKVLGGPHGGIALLFQELRDRGYEVLHEPGVLQNAEYFHHDGIICKDRWYHTKLVKEHYSRNHDDHWLDPRKQVGVRVVRIASFVGRDLERNNAANRRQMIDAIFADGHDVLVKWLKCPRENAD